MLRRTRIGCRRQVLDDTAVKFGIKQACEINMLRFDFMPGRECAKRITDIVSPSRMPRSTIAPGWNFEFVPNTLHPLSVWNRKEEPAARAAPHPAARVTSN